jgi:hypothetical protein
LVKSGSWFLILKSIFIEFGKPLFIEPSFSINGEKLKTVDSKEISGFIFYSDMGKSNKFILNKFNLVRSTLFSLHSIGMKPLGFGMFLHAFLYKTFCLSKFLYGMENMALTDSTSNNLNTMQNSLSSDI